MDRTLLGLSLLLLSGCGGGDAPPDDRAANDNAAGGESHGHGHHHASPESLRPLMNDLRGWMVDLRAALAEGQIDAAAGHARAIAVACDDQDVHDVDPELFGPRFTEIDLELHTAAAQMGEIAEAGDLMGARARYAELHRACVACHAQAPSARSVDLSAIAPPQPEAGSYTFDGFELGDSYASVMSRAPYREPCDNDAIDDQARRFMVYGARPCRDRTFPEQTTVAFYLSYADSGRYDQPIEAFAWMGGSYFTTRSNFPLHTGEPEARAEEVLGGASASFELTRDEHLVLVRHHPADIWSLSAHGQLVGFVVGPMPADAGNEQWRGLMQMYGRYTAAPEP